MKHTQGPWNITKGANVEGDRFYGYIRETKTGYFVAELYRTSSDEEAEANGHLIAAAPELLEACRLALNIIEQCIDYESMPINNRINISNAIKKAEGR